MFRRFLKGVWQLITLPFRKIKEFFSKLFKRVSGFLKGFERRFLHPVLARHKHGPIITPRVEHFWESKATFNPTAVQAGDKTHIIYRAIGDSDMSVLGYTSTTDGYNIDQRHTYPIYFPRERFEMPQGNAAPVFTSWIWGGTGGCEDPKITKVGNRFYMCYVAFNGREIPRLALTSIDADDFLNHRWNWKKPVLISKPGEIDKSGCILPEKVNGKYVVFHRVFPDILVDFVDDLDFDGETKFLEGQYKISPRKDKWDSRKISIGAPPIKTKDGWLVIYHAVGDKDPDYKYKAGAMILAKDDPTKVLYRSDEPILEPEEDYEGNIVYPGGASLVGDHIYVYYGANDITVGVAHAKIDEFTKQLKRTGKPHLSPIRRNGRSKALRRKPRLRA